MVTVANPWLALTSSSSVPFVAPGDGQLVASYNRSCASTIHVLQTKLLPEPFAGDFENCKVLLFAGNPGYDPANDAEHSDPVFRSLTLANLHQRPGRRPSLYFIDPKLKGFECHSWWTGRLGELIRAVGADAVGAGVCVVELLPYHSQKLQFGTELARLPSFAFTRHLVTKALDGGATPVVMRSREKWRTLLGAHFPGRHLECSNPQRPYISRGNLGAGFDEIVRVLS